MGLNWKKLFHRKPDLREACRKDWGDDFLVLYDAFNGGIPVGNLSTVFWALERIEKTKKKLKMMHFVELTGFHEDEQGDYICDNCGWVLCWEWTYCPCCGKMIDWKAKDE